MKANLKPQDENYDRTCATELHILVWAIQLKVCFKTSKSISTKSRFRKNNQVE